MLRTCGKNLWMSLILDVNYLSHISVETNSLALFILNILKDSKLKKEALEA